MNFLAHLYLTSGQSEKVIIGNFMADAVKGNRAISAYQEEIQLGIRIHREIDEFTDRHRLFQQGTRRLHKNFGKYAPIILDIYYDHLLAADWTRYSEWPLQYFAREQYTIIDRHLHRLPERTRFWFDYMKSHDLLFNYAKEESIDFVFKRMDYRTGGISGMGTALKQIEQHKEAYRKEFRDFFEEIRAHIASRFFNGMT